MSYEGYIKLYRRAVFSDVFNDPCLWQLWSYLLLEANFAAGTLTSGRTLAPGQLITSRQKLATLLGCSEYQAYRRLQQLKTRGNISMAAVPGKGGTLITIRNWRCFQSEEGRTANPHKAHSKPPKSAQQKETTGAQQEISENPYIYRSEEPDDDSTRTAEKDSTRTANGQKAHSKPPKSAHRIRINNKNKTIRIAGIQVSLDIPWTTGTAVDALQGWIDYKGKRYTRQQVEALIATWQHLSDNEITAAINHSIASGYKAIYNAPAAARPLPIERGRVEYFQTPAYTHLYRQISEVKKQLAGATGKNRQKLLAQREALAESIQRLEERHNRGDELNSD